MNEIIDVEHGYFDFKKFGNFLIIDSEIIDNTVDFINTKNIKNILISYVKGYKLSNVDFVKKCQNLERVFIVGDNIELESLNSLKKLKFLSTGSNIKKLDFENFKDLEYCAITWQNNFNNIENCPNIIQLRVDKYKYKSKTNDLTLFPQLPKLKHLELVQSSISSLNGIEKFKNVLSEFDGHYLSKLEDVEAVTKLKKLNTLVFTHCKKLKNHSIIENIKSLSKLILTACGEIESISFIKKMKQLRFFSFVDTIITDGDMTPCFNLDYAGFIKKRHYSHSSEEIRKIIQSKNNS